MNKTQRAEVKRRFDGRCAYCGELLSDRWHADHQHPITRISQWVDGVGFQPTGEILRPDMDTLDNIFPACIACNMDKGGYHLEQWRDRLSRTVEVLMRDAPAYRMARRFGLVRETGAPIAFHFEIVAGEAKEEGTFAPPSQFLKV